jgi:hypothetical protein
VVTHVDVSDNGTTDRPLPKEVQISNNTVSFSPNELRMLKAQSGKTLEQIMNDEADTSQMMLWLTLRRQGYTATWEQAADVIAVVVADEPDPTTGGSLTASPPSAGSGE